MSRYQLRLLMLALAAVVLIVVAAFFADWFVLRAAGDTVVVDLRTARACDPTGACSTLEVGDRYSTAAAAAFWSAIALFILVATLAGSKLLAGASYPRVAVLGMIVGACTLLATLYLVFVATPGSPLASGAATVVGRLWGPFVLLSGTLAALLAIWVAARDAALDDEAQPAYRQVVVPTSHERPRRDTHDRRIPVTPISVNKVPMPGAGDTVRAKTPSNPPAVAVARTTSPTSSPGLELPPRAHSSSSGPIDVAARLGGASLGAHVEVAIRPPPPEARVVPDDQIPVDPGSGLVIRKRTASAAPLDTTTLPVPPDVGITVRTRPPSAAPPMMAAVASALDAPPPSSLHAKVRYAVTTATFSSAGITATRTDGLVKLVRWDAIVGIVARRLPSASPYDSTTFVDVVSSAGATMRILPSTEIVGHTLTGDDTERARALVNLLAAQSLDAKLDSATKVFANGSGRAAQLRDDKTLAAHDDRLA